MASIKIEDISSTARFTFDKLNSGKLLDKAFMPTAYIKTFLSSNQLYIENKRRSIGQLNTQYFLKLEIWLRIVQKNINPQ